MWQNLLVRKWRSHESRLPCLVRNQNKSSPYSGLSCLPTRPSLLISQKWAEKIPRGLFLCTLPETGSDWPCFSLSSTEGSYLTVPWVKLSHRWFGFLPPSQSEPLPGISGSMLEGRVTWHTVWPLCQQHALPGVFIRVCGCSRTGTLPQGRLGA